MNNIIKGCVLLIILLCTNVSISQNFSEKKSLLTAFQEFQSAFDYTFSYADSAIENHYIKTSVPLEFEKALAFLSTNTLFQYTILESKTIAVSLAPDVRSICATITNATTNRKLAATAVTTAYQTLRTNANGELILLSKANVISITIDGINNFNKPNFTVQKAAIGCSSISVIQNIEFLDAVLMSNYVTKGIEKQINGGVTINYKKFDILPGLIEPDVLLTLQALPGVQSVNETVSYLNIRGGTNDQNLILWDGIKMYQSGHFFGQISAFNPFLTQEVTLIKNGSSAHYGDGVSGIIDMRSSSKINDSLFGGIGINMISADVFVGIPLSKKASLEISARKSINALVKTPTYNQYFDKIFQNTEVIQVSDIASNSNDQFTFFDSNFRLLYEPTEKDFFRANFVILGNNLSFLENAEIENTRFTRESELSQNNLSSGLYYKRIWNDLAATEVQFYASNYALDAINSDILNDQRLLQTNKVQETGFKTITSFPIYKNIKGFVGYQFNETGITNFSQINNPLFEIEDKKVIRANSVFSEIGYNSWNTSVNLGLRANHITRFNTILIEPRISFNQKFLKYFTFEILGELKSQTTSQVIDFQNDFLGVENRKWAIADPNTNPILRGQQLSAGFTYSHRDLLITAEPYLKHIDGITAQSQGFQNQFQDARSLGSYTVKGVDFLINKQFKKLNTWFSYSYAKNTYNFPDLVPSRFHNNLDIRHWLAYGINYSWNSFKVSGGLNWHSGKPYTSLVANNEIVDDALNLNTPNEESIKDYLRVDLSLLYDFKLLSKYKARFGLSVWNLLDTENTINRFYRLNHSDNFEELNERALRFTPNATLRVWF